MIAQTPLSKFFITSEIIQNYLNNAPELRELYSFHLTLENIQKQAESKSKNYNYRQIIVNELIKQNNEPAQKQIDNLKLLEKSNTFTITTGHQLNLLTGSVFFIYKILQTIKTCIELNHLQSNYYFIPIFWMATEDHDFAEINHFQYKNQTIEWETSQNGAVGSFSLVGLEEALQPFWKLFANENWKTQIEIFIKQSKNLSEFTRKLINYLCKDFGLLILDANNKNLKSAMIPHFKEELLHQTSYKKVTKTNNYLTKNQYKPQVNPREINLFYLDENGRNRIIKNNEEYQVLNTNKKFSKTEIITELENFPEKFSPNVLLRPLYQEVILPNVAYIGGNAEIAYWLQLQRYFQSQKVTFPMLIPRNSVILLNEKSIKKLHKIPLKLDDIFKAKDEIIKQKVMQNTEVEIDFNALKTNIQNIYLFIKKEAIKTDKTFINLVNAHEHKQLKSFEKLQKRLIKAEKKKQSEKVYQIESIFQEIFPNNIPQERIKNIFELSQGNVTDFIQNIYENLNIFRPICFCTVFDK